MVRAGVGSNDWWRTDCWPFSTGPETVAGMGATAGPETVTGMIGSGSDGRGGRLVGDGSDGRDGRRKRRQGWEAEATAGMGGGSDGRGGWWERRQGWLVGATAGVGDTRYGLLYPLRSAMVCLGTRHIFVFFCCHMDFSVIFSFFFLFMKYLFIVERYVYSPALDLVGN
jgi:hypothetical protein